MSFKNQEVYNVYKVKKYWQITIQKRLVRAVCGEVLLDSLHRRFLGLILTHTDTVVPTMYI